jgi:hypothetical protein
VSVAAALGCQVLSRMVYENIPHQLRSDTEEVSAILPLYIPAIYQVQVCLIDQSSRLEGVIGALVAQAAVCQPAQLGIDQREQLFQRLLIPVAPIYEKLCNLFGR